MVASSLKSAFQARLRRMLDNEEALRQSLGRHLEEEALDGLFAHVRALLARGRHGNFTLDEIRRFAELSG